MDIRYQEKENQSTAREKLGNKESPKKDIQVSLGRGNRRDLLEAGGDMEGYGLGVDKGEGTKRGYGGTWGSGRNLVQIYKDNPS